MPLLLRKYVREIIAIRPINFVFFWDDLDDRNLPWLVDQKSKTVAEPAKRSQVNFVHGLLHTLYMFFLHVLFAAWPEK